MKPTCPHCRKKVPPAELTAYGRCEDCFIHHNTVSRIDPWPHAVGWAVPKDLPVGPPPDPYAEIAADGQPVRVRGRNYTNQCRGRKPLAPSRR